MIRSFIYVMAEIFFTTPYMLPMYGSVLYGSFWSGFFEASLL